MAGNRAVVYNKPGSVEIRDTAYPDLIYVMGQA